MHCFLEAGGRFFDVDKFLARSPWLKRSEVTRRGNPVRGMLRNRVGKVSQESTIQVQITSREGAYEKLEPAVKAAIRFVCRWETELKRLRGTSGIMWARLRFGIKWPEGIAVIERTFPAELTALAGKNYLDLHLSVYWAQAWRPEDVKRVSTRGSVVRPRKRKPTRKRSTL